MATVSSHQIPDSRFQIALVSNYFKLWDSRFQIQIDRGNCFNSPDFTFQISDWLSPFTLSGQISDSRFRLTMAAIQRHLIESGNLPKESHWINFYEKESPGIYGNPEESYMHPQRFQIPMPHSKNNSAREAKHIPDFRFRYALAADPKRQIPTNSGKFQISDSQAAF